MASHYIEDQVYEKIDFTKTGLVKAEYDSCKFIACDFSNIDLLGVDFASCVFEGCNLSMAKPTKTAFRDIHFLSCKILGVHFETCNEFLFSVTFDQCVLDLSSFVKMKMKKTTIIQSSLQEVDFTETDLSESIFDCCDFSRAIFDNTNLGKADFRSSHGFSIDPSRNKMKKAKFSMEGAVGLLDKYDIVIG